MSAREISKPWKGTWEGGKRMRNVRQGEKQGVKKIPEEVRRQRPEEAISAR